MPIPSNESEKQARLRRVAETRLKQATTPSTHGTVLSVDALTLLYKFASAPDSAADALKLLHELQVHQVELDLQQTQLDSNERDLVREVSHYKSLFDFAPQAYFIVSLDGYIRDTNLAAVELFALDRDQLYGHSLSSLFAHQSRAAVEQLLQNVRTGDSVAVCEQLLLSNHSASNTQRLRITANLAMNGDSAQIIINEYTVVPHP